MQQTTAPWPQYQTLLAVERTQPFNIGRRLRIAMAIRRTRSLRSLVDQAVDHCPWMRPVMDRHPILFRPLLGEFLDARSDRRTVFENYAHDLCFVSTRLRAAAPGFFPSVLEALLWTDEDQQYKATLGLNLAHPQEGLWQVSLYAPEGVRLFSICFSVVPGPTLFIGAVQGGRSRDGVDVGGLIRTATRQCNGQRPHFLLFEALRSVAAAWGVEQIVGVSTRHQLKSRARRDGRRVMQFSYDDFFRELGAAARTDGNWDVPVCAPERPIATVPSRKRAMYRRREVLLMHLRAAIQVAVAGPQRQCA